MGNPYFKHAYNSSTNEFELYRQATDEIVEMFGIDFKWITKELINEDFIFGEDNLMNFNNSKTVTLLLENYEDFDGVDDMFSKMGFQIDNKLILLCEQNRLKNILGQNPQIDDLLYHQNSGKIFQLKHIKDDVGFYQMNGGRYSYRLTYEIFVPSHEDFDTDIEEVNILNIEDLVTTDEKDQHDILKNVDINFDENDIFGNL